MEFGRRLSVLFSLLYACTVQSTFHYEDCSSNGQSIIDLPEFDVSPDPVDVRGNLTVSLRGHILRDIPGSTDLEVRYYGLRQVFGMQLDILLPCLLGKYGSCTLPLCDYAERYSKQVCPFFTMSNETDCNCPPSAGNYSRHSMDVPMARASAVTRFFLKGKYRTEMRMKLRETGEELACFKFYTELT